MATTGNAQNPAAGYRVVRVLPDEPGLNRTFDYALASTLRGADSVRLGTIVRFPLHGRNLRGWVTGVDVEPPADVVLKSITKVSGYGPPREMLRLSRWIAHRWWGRPASVLRTASPDRSITGLPPRPRLDATLLDPADGEVARVARDALAAGGVRVLRVAPSAEATAVVVEAVRHAGSAGVLVLAPTLSAAAHVSRQLRRLGLPVALLPDDWSLAAVGGCVVIGSRGAAVAPIAAPGAYVVLDEHDEAYQQEQMPTWNARDIVVERAERDSVPCLLVTPVPSLASVARFPVDVPGRSVERAGWPAVTVIDRSHDAPGRQGLLSEPITNVLRSDGIVLCILNRKGRAALLVCASCDTVARCERCDGALGVLADRAVLVCSRCSLDRPDVCAACGGSRFRNVRMGVNRAREEIEALALRPVAEVVAEGPLPDDRVEVLVGTEALLHRVPRADTVVFLDLDSELLAPRYRAGEQALGLLARAARLVGGRSSGGRLVLQTRLPEHEVIRAVTIGDPSDFIASELDRRRGLGLPPFGGLATVSGAGADEVASSLRGDERVRIGGPVGGPYNVGAGSWDLLADALALVERPSVRVRIEVDPLRA